MKAKSIAILLSFFVMSMPLQAESLPTNNSKNPQKIDLNKADLSGLTGSFKGIGKKRAEAIIAYRDSHQGFKSIEELAEVRGLGQHFMETNREQLNQTYVVQ
jgi:competence protein ComEA